MNGEIVSTCNATGKRCDSLECAVIGCPHVRRPCVDRSMIADRFGDGRVTDVLDLLCNDQITLKKAMEWIRDYTVDGVIGPITTEPAHTIELRACLSIAEIYIRDHKGEISKLVQADDLARIRLAIKMSGEL